MELTFVGTGGGRFTMIKQLRRTGGMHLTHNGFSMYIDPGPGALVHAQEAGIDLDALDAITVTHAHLDHYGDMKALIEAMTDGGDKETGRLLIAESVIDGAQLPDKYIEGKGTYGTEVDAVLDTYHEALVNDVTVLQEGTELDVGPLRMDCIQTEHSDPTAVGFTLAYGDNKIGFSGDTELFDGLLEFFDGCDMLVLNVARPKGEEWKGHLTVEDAADILNTVQPEFAVLHHFGSLLIYESVQEQEAWLAKQTDVDVVMAEDGMTIDVEQPQSGLEQFL